MSGKSIRFSIYAVVLFALLIIAIINLFKFNILLGIAGVILLIFPAKLQRIALDEASGTADKIIAKYIAPALAVILTFFAIMAIAVWIK